MREPRTVTSVDIVGCGVVVLRASLCVRHGVEARLYNRPTASLATVKDRVRTALELLRAEGVIDAATVSAALDRVLVFDDLAGRSLPPAKCWRPCRRTSSSAGCLRPGRGHDRRRRLIGLELSGLRRADIVAASSTIRSAAWPCIRPTRPT